MKVALDTGGPARLWHRRLAEALAERGHALVLRRTETSRPLPAGLAALLACERRLYGARSDLFQIIEHEGGADETADLAIVPLFDDAPGEAVLFAALLQGTVPLVTIRGMAGGVARTLASGLPAVEEPGVLARALDQFLVRLVALVVQAIRHPLSEEPPAASAPFAPEGHATPVAFLTRNLARKIAGRLGPARGTAEHWRIGFRRIAGPGVAATGDWPDERYTLLPEDGKRFQADPFSFEHDGRAYVFFEDFPYATRKGLIRVVEIGADGRPMPARTALERGDHLSYPYVLAHEGAIYMLPEMSQARRIQLFRADPFPDRWVPDHVLVEDVVAGDATPILHEGRWWLFATLAGDGGSTWDQLGLFHAPSLLGPWTPHAANPVLIDARAARPAGAMWHEGGALMRVAQDCRAGYGKGIAICRVDRLDTDGYAQTLVRRLGPPDDFGADGVHTLNRSTTLEVIDLRWPSRRDAPILTREAGEDPRYRGPGSSSRTGA